MNIFRFRIITILLFNLLILSTFTYGGTGARLFTGYTKIASGNFYSAINGGAGSESSNPFFGASLYAGTSQFEYAISWYTLSMKSTSGNTTLNGSSNLFLFDLAIRPLELGRSSGIAIQAGFDFGVGHASATLGPKEFEGWFYQPGITIDIPLSSSDEGQYREGKFYPATVFSLDLRAGFRIADLELNSPDFYPNGKPKIDFGGGFVSLGITIFFNPR
jgi:hypothetical protein